MMRDILSRLTILEESTAEFEGPQVGDEFGLSFSEDLEISTTIVDMLEDGFVVQMDDDAMMHMQENGITFLEGEVVEEEIEEGEQHGNSKIYNKCWKGYRKVPGKKRGEEGSCVKEGDIDIDKMRDSDKKWIDVARLMADAASKISFKTDAGIELSNDVERLASVIVNNAPDIRTPAIGDQFYKMIQSYVSKADDLKSSPKEIMKFVDDAVKQWEGGADFDRSKIKDPEPQMDTEESTDLDRIVSLAGVAEDKAGWSIKGSPKPAPKASTPHWRLNKDGTSTDMNTGTTYNRDGSVVKTKEEDVDEAEYQGRKVSLGKPTRGDVKKFKVYVKNPNGNVVKVNFGDPNMKIKKSNPARRKSFRARHNCDNPGPRHKARYWSCRKW